MNNLTTRKIVLGLLMTCVLAFGVQGIADAVTDPGWTDQADVEAIADTRVGSAFNLGSLTLTGQKVGTTESVTITISSGITLSEPVHSTRSVTLREKEVADNDPQYGGQPAR